MMDGWIPCPLSEYYICMYVKIMQSESVGTKLLIQILVCLPTKVATTLLCNINEITLSHFYLYAEIDKVVLILKFSPIAIPMF